MMGVILVLATIGLVLGFVIGVAVKFFGTEPDPRVEKIEALLPTANCGGCGFAGCADFARALVAGKAAPDRCPSTNATAAAQIAAVLGVAVAVRQPKVAVVLCGGDGTKAQRAGLYNGVNDCRDAALVAGGAKACLYGCLGLGSCARACPFNAIEITAARLAVVHPDVCVGCGKCVAACPRRLIRLVPKSAVVHVLCNSPEKGAAKRKKCSAACIGCQKCVKTAPAGSMSMEGALARVNYDQPPDSASIAAVCPTHCLQPSLLVSATAPVPAAPASEVAHA
jgi:electron transport complex protein RnfB